MSKYQQNEPIAIIGMGCRFPGGANSPETFWELLKNGIDAITEVPASRFNIDKLYDPDPSKPGKVVTRYGGFLNDVDKFDADFFGISPREAESMDPQQRLLLEVSWEALEDAGVNVDTLTGSRTGLFTGLWSGDYEDLLYNATSATDLYMTTGGGRYSTAGRISYLLDLQGPCMAVDTACSSSLVSVHLACQSLLSDESDLALAGGVNLILHPAISIAYSKAGMLSPDGRCKFGDASANGYVRSEGCGMLALKRLSSAQVDGDRIYASIICSAINHDGHEGLFVAPNQKAQEKLIRYAYKRAAVSPDQVGYVEAHGTGTSVGDPVEIRALSAFFKSFMPSYGKYYLGSVKTNIGHTEAASGVAGIIKAAMVLYHKHVPPSLHFNKPNPEIDWDHIPFEIPKTMKALNPKQGLILANVNSFGVSGTNAHVILQEAPEQKEPISEIEDYRQTFLLPLSARNEGALLEMARNWRSFLKNMDADSPTLYEICYSASVHRSQHDHRLTIVCGSRDELLGGLDAIERKKFKTGLSLGRRNEGQRNDPVFVFSGQGPQWFAMGRELMAQEPVYRSVLEECANLLSGYTNDWSLIEELQKDESMSRLDQTEITQPAIFALQVGLAALWRSWGIEPGAVIGHSVGEVAAACVAGILPLDQAVRVVYHRGRLLQRATGKGRMAVVEVSKIDAERLVEEYKEKFSIAAVNSPNSVTLSGDGEALREVIALLRQRNVFCRLMSVNYAFHSTKVEPYRNELIDALDGLERQPAAIPIVSTVTGDPASGNDFNAKYWANNIRRPVRFAEAIQRLLETGHTTFLELSPHPVLAGNIIQCIEHQNEKGTVLASLRRNRGEHRTLLEALGALYTQGHRVKWESLYPKGGRRIALPTYPWQRKRFWFELVGKEGSKLPHLWQSFPGEKSQHPLLGRRLDSPFHTYESRHTTTSLTDEYEHRIHGATILPMTGYLGMALVGAGEVLKTDTDDLVIDELVFHEAMVFADNGARTLQIIFSHSGNSRVVCQIFSRDNATPAGAKHADWQRHMTGTIGQERFVEHSERELMALQLEEIKDRCHTQINGPGYYDQLKAMGFHFGLSRQSIEEVWRADGEALAKLRLADGTAIQSNTTGIHQSFLDASIQLFAAVLPQDSDDAVQKRILLPVKLDALRTSQYKGLHVWSHVLSRPVDPNDTHALILDIRLYDAEGRRIGSMKGLHFKSVNRRRLVNIHKKMPAERLFDMVWIPKNLESSDSVSGQPEDIPPQTATEDFDKYHDYDAFRSHRSSLPISPKEIKEEMQAEGRLNPWLIFADYGGISDTLAERLRDLGQDYLLIYPGSFYDKPDENVFRINPEKFGDFQRLLQDLAGSGGLSPAGIVHLWSIDAIESATILLSKLTKDSVRKCTSALYLSQAVASTGILGKGRIWLVTRGALPAGKMRGPFTLEQAPLWGLGRALDMEIPEFWGGMVDLDPEAPMADSAECLLREIQIRDGENQIAYRDGQRFVARLENVSQIDERRKPFAWRPDGVYIITGGLGRLGLKAAHWMATQGARHLMLVGRQGLSLSAESNASHTDNDTRQKVDAIRAIERLGASVKIVQGDVSDWNKMSALFEQFGITEPPLKGIMHAAGNIEIKRFADLDTKDIETAFQPKVMGAWVLHQLSIKMDLDFFVLFSSGASIWGSKGLCHYAAANHFLDVLAHHRRRHNLPALSVNWGWWQGGGTTPETDAHFARTGIIPMPADECFDMLGNLMNSSETQKIVSGFDWQIFGQILEVKKHRPFIEGMLGRSEEELEISEGGLELRRRLEESAAADRKGILLNHLREMVAQVLGFDHPDLLETKQGFFSLGMDSFMALELKSLLEKSLAQKLHRTIAFEYPNIDALSGYLLNDVLRLSGAAHADSIVEPSPTSAKDLNEDHEGNLSEDELVNLLSKKLKGLNERP